jgi:aspartyl protease family protein
MIQPLQLAVAAAIAMVVVGTLLPRGFIPLNRAEPVAASARPSNDPPQQTAMSYGGSETLEADAAGHFHAQAEIEGRVVAMIVDTGATFVSLSAEDAARVGLEPMPSDYTIAMSTANGTTHAAPVRLREIRVGAIVARDVPAVVLQPGLLGQSLLGMSFLKTVGHVEMGSRQLVLRE